MINAAEYLKPQPKILCDENHLYTVDGRPAPSVSAIKNQFTDWSKVPQDLLGRAQGFGTAVHKVCEVIDNCGTFKKPYDAALQPYVDQWIQWLSDNKVELIAVELMLHSPLYNFCGTIDRMGIIDGRVFTIDIKTSTTVKADVRLQTAGYEQLWNENIYSFGTDDKYKSAGRKVVQLTGTGKAVEHNAGDHTDWPAFQNLAQFLRWRGRVGA